MKRTLVITSIASPNKVMKSCAEGSKKSGTGFLVIGDTKSPVTFELEDCDFYSVARQRSLSFRLAKELPEKHYSRKNIGYLLSKDSDVIIETDDDNFPRKEFWDVRQREHQAMRINNAGWVNAYTFFSQEKIWPRGFPVEMLTDDNVIDDFGTGLTDCPIQQGLADENPDVDAIYRMTMPLPVNFEKHKPVALGSGSWCPFNSQNTTWFKDAYPLLYLPSYCSFRMTDIWRSFIAQRIAWTCGWSVLFHNATVWQERNAHNLLKDFEDEVPGYLNNARICKTLEDLDLLNGQENISENLIRCYKKLSGMKIFGEGELPLLESWVADLGQ